MSATVKVAIRLHDRRRKTYGYPIGYTNHHSCAMWWLAPTFTDSIHMPRARYSHVSMQHDSVVPHDFYVFASAANFFDGLTNSW